tara:strand:- start:6349 stop:6537 length:189 start_codon:yes stop_codon:yes gene_type:complete
MDDCSDALGYEYDIEYSLNSDWRSDVDYVPFKHFDEKVAFEWYTSGWLSRKIFNPRNDDNQN